MSNLSFNFLPHRREFLEIGIGTKLRQEFAYNSYTPLPKVRLFSPQEAQAAGYPGGGIGWFNFKTTEIGVLVFNNRSPFVAWQMATGVTVHEHLHWLWSLSPTTVGCQNESDRFVMNVFADAANEQRAILESRWGGRFLRRTREILLPEAWNTKISDPLYLAGHLTLAIHTLLAVKGIRILRKLHNAQKPENFALDLSNLCEKEFKREVPESLKELWLKAFALSLRAWTAESDFTRFSLAQDFIALFPPPLDTPPDSPLDMGGHLHDDKERKDNPAGMSKTGKPIKAKKISGSDKAAKSETSSPNSVQAQDFENSPAELPAERTPPTTEMPISGDNSSENQTDSNSPSPQALSFDEVPTLNDEEKNESTSLTEEVRELNLPSVIMPGAIVHGTPNDRVYPADPRSLIAGTQGDATALAERLRIVARPRSRTKDVKGRVVSRIVAQDPAAKKPFRSRTGLQKAFGPSVFVAFLADTSGSMKRGGKAKAARRAAMTVHLSCVQEKVPHLIATSRTLEMLAGKGIQPEKSNALIAGLAPESGGDNYLSTLPQVVGVIRKRPEQVRVLLVLTDGQPGNPDYIKEVVEKARLSGVIVVGIGLELSEGEKTGMKYIFGSAADQTVLVQSEGFARTTAEVLSNAVTRGSRTSLR